MKKLSILVITVSFFAGLLPAYAGLIDNVRRISEARAESNESGAPDLEGLTCDEQVAALQEYVAKLECQAGCNQASDIPSRYRRIVRREACFQRCSVRAED